EELALPVILASLRAAQGDRGGGGVVIADDDAAGSAAGQAVSGAIRIRVGGRDVEREDAQAVVVEVERSDRVGGAEDLHAVLLDADGDGAQTRAGVADVPGEELVLSVVLAALRAAQHNRRRGGVVVADVAAAGSAAA